MHSCSHGSIWDGQTLLTNPKNNNEHDQDADWPLFDVEQWGARGGETVRRRFVHACAHRMQGVTKFAVVLDLHKPSLASWSSLLVVLSLALSCVNIAPEKKYIQFRREDISISSLLILHQRLVTPSQALAARRGYKWTTLIITGFDPLSYRRHVNNVRYTLAISLDMQQALISRCGLRRSPFARLLLPSDETTGTIELDLVDDVDQLIDSQRSDGEEDGDGEEESDAKADCSTGSRWVNFSFLQ